MRQATPGLPVAVFAMAQWPAQPAENTLQRIGKHMAVAFGAQTLEVPHATSGGIPAGRI